MTGNSLDIRYPLGSGGGGGGGAPETATYVVGAADATLTNELVLGSAVIMAGGIASRAAASLAGVLFFATDTGALYRDDGATWTLINTPTAYIPGGTDVAVADGGTGASTDSGARTNLGVDYTTLDERTRDVMGTALVAGTNVTITPNDGADTITIAATGGGAAAISDLSDVDTTGAATGSVLIKSSGDWVDGQVDLADPDAVTGLLPDANIAASIARDSEVAAAYQPLDADLTAVAALTRTRGDVIVGGAAAWTDLAVGTRHQGLTTDGTDVVWGSRGYVMLGDIGASASLLAADTTLLAAAAPTTGGTQVVGEVIHLRSSGLLINTSGSNGTFTFKIKVGGTTVWTTISPTHNTGVANRTWFLDAWLVCEGVGGGGGGTITALGLFNASGTGNTQMVAANCDVGFQIGNPTNNVSVAIDLTVVGSVNHANFTCSSGATCIERFVP